MIIDNYAIKRFETIQREKSTYEAIKDLLWRLLKDNKNEV